MGRRRTQIVSESNSETATKSIERSEYLAVYESLSNQIRSEISEYYRIHMVFLLILGAIVSVAAAVEEPHSVLFDVGALASLFWFLATLASIRWRYWWMIRAGFIEGKLWGKNNRLGQWRAVLRQNSRFNIRRLRTYRALLQVDYAFLCLSVVSAILFVAAAIAA